MKKYEFTDNEKEYHQTTFRQIRALTDIEMHGVKAGDLGGWIEEEFNLSQEGSCWVDKDSFVLRSARVVDDARIKGKSIVDFRSRVGGTAVVLNSVVHGINSVGGESLIADSDIRGQCILRGNSRIESSKIEGLHTKGDVLIHNSQCFTRRGRLTMEPGCTLKETELHLLDESPYLAQNTVLIGVEAFEVPQFRIFDRNVTLKDERYVGGRRVKIGTERKFPNL